MSEEQIREIVESMNQVLTITSDQKEMIIKGLRIKNEVNNSVQLDKTDDENEKEWTLINLQS